MRPILLLVLFVSAISRCRCAATVRNERRVAKTAKGVVEASRSGNELEGRDANYYYFEPEANEDGRLTYGKSLDIGEYGVIEDDGDYVYLVTGPEKNVSGVLISDAIVASTVQNGKDVKLCLRSTCQNAVIEKKLSNIYMWKLSRKRKKPLTFDFAALPDAKCEMDYEAIHVNVSHPGPDKIECDPPCGDGAVVICDSRVVGLVYGNPPRLANVQYLMGKLISPKTSMRNEGARFAKPAKAEQKPHKPDEEESAVEHVRTSWDTGTAVKTSLVALISCGIAVFTRTFTT